MGSTAGPEGGRDGIETPPRRPGGAADAAAGPGRAPYAGGREPQRPTTAGRTRAIHRCFAPRRARGIEGRGPAGLAGGSVAPGAAGPRRGAGRRCVPRPGRS